MLRRCLRCVKGDTATRKDAGAVDGTDEATTTTTHGDIRAVIACKARGKPTARMGKADRKLVALCSDPAVHFTCKPNRYLYSTGEEKRKQLGQDRTLRHRYVTPRQLYDASGKCTVNQPSQRQVRFAAQSVCRSFVPPLLYSLFSFRSPKPDLD